MTNLTDRQILDAVREALEETAPTVAKDKRKPADAVPVTDSNAQANERTTQR